VNEEAIARWAAEPERKKIKYEVDKCDARYEWE
jgi:hypothetical protein